MRRMWGRRCTVPRPSSVFVLRVWHRSFFLKWNETLADSYGSRQFILHRCNLHKWHQVVSICFQTHLARSVTNLSRQDRKRIPWLYLLIWVRTTRHVSAHLSGIKQTLRTTLHIRTLQKNSNVRWKIWLDLILEF